MPKVRDERQPYEGDLGCRRRSSAAFYAVLPTELSASQGRGMEGFKQPQVFGPQLSAVRVHDTASEAGLVGSAWCAGQGWLSGAGASNVACSCCASPSCSVHLQSAGVQADTCFWHCPGVQEACSCPAGATHDGSSGLPGSTGCNQLWHWPLHTRVMQGQLWQLITPGAPMGHILHLLALPAPHCSLQLTCHAFALQGQPWLQVRSLTCQHCLRLNFCEN